MVCHMFASQNVMVSLYTHIKVTCYITIQASEDEEKTDDGPCGLDGLDGLDGLSPVCKSKSQSVYIYIFKKITCYIPM